MSRYLWNVVLGISLHSPTVSLLLVSTMLGRAREGREKNGSSSGAQPMVKESHAAPDERTHRQKESLKEMSGESRLLLSVFQSKG